MPTVDELPAAQSVSDRDELLLAQNGTAVRATRAQVLSGVQKQIFLEGGCLLGRASAGVGEVESIGIGANLSIVRGSLTAQKAFDPTALSDGTVPVGSDDVLMVQANSSRRVSYGAFLAGLSSVAGVDFSHGCVTPAGAGVARDLATLLAETVTIESFGAVGDGVRDDTAAFQAALASGRPLRLGARTYIVTGALTAEGDVFIVGSPGVTKVCRGPGSANGVWFDITGPSFFASGVIWDGTGTVGNDGGLLGLQAGVECATMVRCSWSGGWADGLQLVGASRCMVLDCEADGNARHGVAIGGAGDVSLLGVRFSDNQIAGLNVTGCSALEIRRCRFEHNGSGADIFWSQALPSTIDANFIFLSENLAQWNRVAAFRVNGDGAALFGNIARFNSDESGATAIATRGAGVRLVGNAVSGASVGVDSRGCSGLDLQGNRITTCQLGILLDGASDVLCQSNRVVGCETGVRVRAVEPLISASPANRVRVVENTISLTSQTSVGIFIEDGAEGVVISKNFFDGADFVRDTQALWLHTDSASVTGNSWNGRARAQAISLDTKLLVPDYADAVLADLGAGVIQTFLTFRQNETLGQVLFVRVTDGGAGYSTASITIEGSGRGATASAIISDGSVTWVTVTNPGFGYGAIGDEVAVTISGDGHGATATAVAGLPPMSGRAIDVVTKVPLTIASAGSAPRQNNWTGFDVQVPAYGAVRFEGDGTSWTVLPLAAQDYLRPTGDGGAVLQSVAGGDVWLRPSGNGAIHFASAGEPMGCVSRVGRGAPSGMVTAPPGSDYRNLNGGVGTTFWLKQVGTDANGWVAVA